MTDTTMTTALAAQEALQQLRTPVAAANSAQYLKRTVKCCAAHRSIPVGCTKIQTDIADQRDTQPAGKLKQPKLRLRAFHERGP